MRLIRSAFFFTMITVMSLSACSNAEQDKARQKEVSDSLLQVQQDSLLDMFKSELEAISETINEVSVRNGLLNTDTAEGEVLSKQRIIERVGSLDDLLTKNQKQLDDLYARMRKSKVKNDELEKLINNMQSRISERESEIDKLMTMLSEKDVQIEEVRTRLDTMRRDNIELTEDIIEMDQEMHLVYYIIGEQKELRDKGIVTKEGGILGLGASKKLDVGQLDRSLFKEVDQREVKDIPLYSKKAKLITNHPESSYKFTMGEDGDVETLVILDRKSFWAATDYLVVEVDN